MPKNLLGLEEARKKMVRSLLLELIILGVQVVN